MSVNLSNAVDAAMARKKADIVIKDVQLLNVIDGTIKRSDIAIMGDQIVGTYETYSGETEIDGRDLVAVPGFIDSHVHVESSQISPMEFDRCVLPQGTTTAVCDPHEIANVLGDDGLRYVVEASEHTKMDMLVALSSCVPATSLETSGAELLAADLIKYKDHKNVVGLAEFMNIGGVLAKDDEVMEKLDAWADGHIDGHMPGIRGMIVNAMATCGICNCHESISAQEAEEKIAKGVQVFVREGSVTKNADEIGAILNPFNSPWVGLCTDDRNPMDIASEGHIDHVIRKVLATGADLVSVYRAASLSAAIGFGLHKNTPKWKKRGHIAPGWKADVVLLGDAKKCDVKMVIKNGEIVTPEIFENRPIVKNIGYNSIKIDPVAASDFTVKAKDGVAEYDVIGLIKDQIATRHLKMPLRVNADGTIGADVENDILKLAVIERHGRSNGNFAKAFITGFGFKQGAIASSVGHDSHNITAVGATDEDMALAVNRVRENHGGYVVVRNGEILAELPLPIAGLMSDKPYEQVREDIIALREGAVKLNANMDEPFMLMAFMPLCVIPQLKLTDFGLVRFDPENGDEGPVLIDDQRSPAP